MTHWGRCGRGAAREWRSVDALAPDASTPSPRLGTPDIDLNQASAVPVEEVRDRFLDGSPTEALETAREAAGRQDVRIGRGPTVVRDFLAAGLVDHMHLVQVPIVLGRGVSVWDGLEALEDAYDVEAVSSPNGVTH